MLINVKGMLFNAQHNSMIKMLLKQFLSANESFYSLPIEENTLI